MASDQKTFMDDVAEIYEFKMHATLKDDLMEIAKILATGKSDAEQLYDLRGYVMPRLETHAAKAKELQDSMRKKRPEAEKETKQNG